MARRIRKATTLQMRPDRASLRGWNEAIMAGTATPEQAGIAYSGAPMFRRMEGIQRRMGAPEPTPASQLSAQYWGAAPTPTSMAANEQAIAESELGAATSRAGIPLAGRQAELPIKAGEQQLGIEQQRAEQDAALHAPTLEAAGLANLQTQQAIDRETATLPIDVERAKGAPTEETLLNIRNKDVSFD